MAICDIREILSVSLQGVTQTSGLPQIQTTKIGERFPLVSVGFPLVSVGLLRSRLVPFVSRQGLQILLAPQDPGRSWRGGVIAGSKDSAPQAETVAPAWTNPYKLAWNPQKKGPPTRASSTKCGVLLGFHVNQKGRIM